MMGPWASWTILPAPRIRGEARAHTTRGEGTPQLHGDTPDRETHAFCDMNACRVSSFPDEAAGSLSDQYNCKGLMSLTETGGGGPADA